jgi:REP element-mobilizing transposase RayT
MSRRLRFIPEGGSLVEVTCRTVQGRHLLRPSLRVNEIIAGVLGRAQRLYDVRICAFVFVSSHYHLLLDVDNARQLSNFMRYLNSNLTREMGRLVDWSDGVWSRRYQAIPVSGEEGAQIARLKYLLSHGVKEGLVGRPREWPGLHAIGALTDGEPIEGYWFSRTLEYAARQRGEKFDRLQYATRETVTLTPLPCWKDLSADARRTRALSLIGQIETEAANRRAETGAEPLGVAAILGQHPHHRPRHLKKSPAPLFHAISQTVRRELYEGYAWFVAAFRQAAEKLIAGDRSAAFPTGSFPPALPFVGG